MKRIGFSLVLMVLSSTAFAAGHWRVGPGPAGVTGMNDVSDLIESNYNNTHTSTRVDLDLLIPVGLSVQGTYQWDSGVRLDLGAGPFFMLLEDSSSDIDTNLDHTELPISGTVGYTFLPNATASPYVRAGLAYHIVSGSYVDSSDPGVLAAVGVEFLRKSVVSVAIEVATDRSEVTFDRYACYGCRRTTAKLNTYDTVFSVFVKF